jgi:hypothetical protein
MVHVQVAGDLRAGRNMAGRARHRRGKTWAVRHWKASDVEMQEGASRRTVQNAATQDPRNMTRSSARLLGAPGKGVRA